MAPSLPWAILRCLNLCIICHLAFYPCGSKKPTASSVLAAPQYFQYSISGELTGSHNVVWLLWTPAVEFSLLYSLPVSALQNVQIYNFLSLCFIQHQVFCVCLSSFISLCISLCILWIFSSQVSMVWWAKPFLKECSFTEHQGLICLYITLIQESISGIFDALILRKL